MVKQDRHCLFVTDLHGSERRYQALFGLIAEEEPAAVFLGGDLLPSGLAAFSGAGGDDFVEQTLAGGFRRLCRELGRDAPRVFLILGNDDGRFEEQAIRAGDAEGIWEYVHGRRVDFGDHAVHGYAHVPPTPFLLKDWEKYDVSRFTDVGCLSPERGRLSVPREKHELRYGTIAKDLEQLAGDRSLERAVFLFHTPPYRTKLDRAALDGKSVDHAPLDVHVGSVAVRRFIEASQPLLTLHGHVHESARLTGAWRDRIGRTHCFSAAHGGPELAVVRFRLDDPASARRELI